MVAVVNVMLPVPIADLYQQFRFLQLTKPGGRELAQPATCCRAPLRSRADSIVSPTWRSARYFGTRANLFDLRRRCYPKFRDHSGGGAGCVAADFKPFAALARIDQDSSDRLPQPALRSRRTGYPTPFFIPALNEASRGEPYLAKRVPVGIAFDLCGQTPPGTYQRDRVPLVFDPVAAVRLVDTRPIHRKEVQASRFSFVRVIRRFAFVLLRIGASARASLETGPGPVRN